MFVIPIKVLILFLGPIQTGGSGKEGMWRELSQWKVVPGEAENTEYSKDIQFYTECVRELGQVRSIFCSLALLS